MQAQGEDGSNKQELSEADLGMATECLKEEEFQNQGEGGDKDKDNDAKEQEEQKAAGKEKV